MDLRAWCETWLGSVPVHELFRTGHLSVVLGVELADGRAVVLKRRPASARVQGCVEVQRHLSRAGFPCPSPLTDAVPLAGWTVSAETYVPGGVQLDRDADRPRLFAEALARFVRLAPAPDAVSSVAPAPPWVGWAHGSAGVWPWPDDMDVDLNTRPGPAWLDDLGRRVRDRLVAVRHASVIGHGDWESQNLRWQDHRLHAVHDWDSVVCLPEPAIAGAAAAVFTETGGPLEAATIDETDRFLAAYARGGDWGAEEHEIAWAAGLWVRAFNAKKASLVDGGSPVLDRLAHEAKTRLRRAGA
ncbi:phosphotransferase [Nonomuraea sp. NEAU-A123]|uniref:phosphotransferase n=1 Tax=Nonomuraea sp. NEAU-A123 TaxID=2839649 RepID=UPI001BE4C6DE|nr:phosphotransferase [Nonomuraea sp. NEAU-A123]MBT2233304.1 phosphotransferase [Nonomuraea sp. NEAU-A123]